MENKRESIYAIMMAAGYLFLLGVSVNQKQIGIWIACNLAAFLGYWMKNHNRKKPGSLSLIGMIFCKAACLFFFGNLLSGLILYFAGKQVQTEMTTPSSLIAVLCFVVIGPLGEEAMFRGIILKNLTTTVSDHQSLFISSVWFAAAHFIGGGLNQVLYALFLGLCCGSLYQKEESLFPPVLFHMFCNLFTLIWNLYDTSRIVILLFTISSVLFLLCKRRKERIL